jgi:hypothetical protein
LQEGAGNPAHLGIQLGVAQPDVLWADYQGFAVWIKPSTLLQYFSDGHALEWGCAVTTGITERWHRHGVGWKILAVKTSS